eukprot:TRINITY_DN62707_c1_g1_i2.p1 TRINITY_DN62707_c1_g1~~TRINITY_DN62707_c1_g1_i2.p1  ORF type:complete len:604 (-),score=35.39 TRINITY_DN62707_c1_g1_i2:306-2117(-)
MPCKLQNTEPIGPPKNNKPYGLTTGTLWIPCCCCRTQPGQTLSCCHGSCCATCMEIWIEYQVESNRALHCPSCRRLWTHDAIKALLTPTQLKSWENAVTTHLIRTMPDYVDCPNPSCDFGMLVSDGTSCTYICCPQCETEFCFACKVKYHFGKACDAVTGSVQRERMMTKPCPHCFAAIEKNGGCPNMTCWHCGGAFRWDQTQNHIQDSLLPKAYPKGFYKANFRVFEAFGTNTKNRPRTIAYCTTTENNKEDEKDVTVQENSAPQTATEKVKDKPQIVRRTGVAPRPPLTSVRNTAATPNNRRTMTGSSTPTMRKPGIAGPPVRLSRPVVPTTTANNKETQQDIPKPASDPKSTPSNEVKKPTPNGPQYSHLALLLAAQEEPVNSDGENPTEAKLAQDEQQEGQLEIGRQDPAELPYLQMLYSVSQTTPGRREVVPQIVKMYTMSDGTKFWVDVLSTQFAPFLPGVRLRVAGHGDGVVVGVYRRLCWFVLDSNKRVAHAAARCHTAKQFGEHATLIDQPDKPSTTAMPSADKKNETTVRKIGRKTAGIPPTTTPTRPVRANPTVVSDFLARQQVAEEKRQRKLERARREREREEMAATRRFA